MRAAFALAALFCITTAGAADDFAYLRAIPGGGRAVIVDVRPLADCKARSLEGARCLPATDFLGPQGRLPDARNLLWLLGTAGLSGDEQVLIVGQDATARDFVAGLLHVAGQRSVLILTEPVARALDAGAAAGPGRERAFIREAVFEAPMRDDLLVLREELATMRIPPLLLDGRSDREYWGETARTTRTGHLPGAISLPAAQLRSAPGSAAAASLLPGSSEAAVAYAQNPYEGFAYLTLLTAGHGVRARLYAEGWAEWAADGSLPIDAAGFPERAVAAAGRETDAATVLPSPPTLLAAALALLLSAYALGWWFARRRTA